MSHKHEHTYVLRDLWAIVVRYRWHFIVPAFLVAATVLSIGLTLPRKYKATGVFERRNDLVLAEISSRGATNFQDPRATLAEEVSGIAAIDEVVDSIWPELIELGVATGEQDRQKMREMIWRRVDVHFEIGSPNLDRIRVEYVGLHPEMTKLVVNGLISNYITRTRAALDGRLRQSSAFFENEVARHRGQIEQLENQILQFEIDHGDLLPETPNNVQSKLTALQEALSQTTTLHDATAIRIEGIRQALADTPATLPTVVTAANPEIQRLREARRAIDQQLRQSREVQKMTDSHPDVVVLRDQIRELEREIASLDTTVVTQTQHAANPRRAELELSLATAISEQRAYADQMGAIRRQVDALTATSAAVYEVRSRHRKLNRDLSDAQRQLGFWEDNLRRVELALTAESGNRGVQLDVLRMAETPRRPVSPDMGQVLAVSALLAVGAGLISVFLRYRSDETFSDSEVLSQEMGLPLLGAVSEIVTANHRRVRTLRQLVVYPAVVGAMILVLGGLAMLLYLDLNDGARLADWKVRALTFVTPAVSDAPGTQLASMQSE